VLQGNATLASYSYDPAGRLAQVTRANSAQTSYRYDGADRLTGLTTVAGSSTVSSFAYTVNRIGLRASVTETLATGAQAGMAAERWPAPTPAGMACWR
jgi:YD repeat-containing protein